ncbi:hypothetical protein MHYP_G00316610 [Metynnis hypsauchen]
MLFSFSDKVAELPCCAMMLITDRGLNLNSVSILTKHVPQQCLILAQAALVKACYLGLHSPLMWADCRVPADGQAGSLLWGASDPSALDATAPALIKAQREPPRMHLALC